MSTEKNLLTSRRYFGANSIDTFINLELTGEKSVIKPFKTDNVLDIEQKFNQERNSSTKFCVYGLMQSKWCDCESVKIDFYISDSTSNTTPSDEKYVFWVYDKTTNITASTWSVVSRSLDNKDGKLSLNLYNKKKGSYFFPFEIDLKEFPKKTDGTINNKSIFIKIEDTLKNAYLLKEIPFFFFDNEGNVLEFGQEIADVLDDGTIIEINNNYPFLYERHWIREELNPTGPPYVYFVQQESITLNEGGNNSLNREDKLYPIEISLSEPSKSGFEMVRVDILYGLDQEKKPYTTVIAPSDVILQNNIIEWNKPGENPLKYVYLKLIDDYVVEPQERITFVLTPIYGCLPDPDKSQILSIYINDNDIPSYVSFTNQNINFTEPRISNFKSLGNPNVGFFVPIRVEFQLDKAVLIDNQHFDVYIDREETDYPGDLEFRNLVNPPASIAGRSYSDSGYTRVFLEKNSSNLNFFVNLWLKPNEPEYDMQRKIVLKMSGLTVNLVQKSITNNPENNLTIFVNKDIDNNYALINIPYNNSLGKTIVRNVYNTPNPNYSETRYPQNSGGLITTMSYFSGSRTGEISPNTQVTGITVQSGQNVKSVVEEQEFQIIIRNIGKTQVYLDYHLYAPGQELIIDVKSGITLSTSTDVFTYDGDKFILKLPANNSFAKSEAIPIFNYTGGSYFLAIQEAENQGKITYSAQTYGFNRCDYEIQIKNKSYNYVGNNPERLTEPTRSGFYNINLLTKQIFSRKKDASGNVSYEKSLILSSGNDIQKSNYYIGTELLNVNTRSTGTQYDLTGQTTSLLTGPFFYNGIAILPNTQDSDLGFFSNNQTGTDSTIFVTDENIIDVNQLTLVTGATAYSYILPTTPIILSRPFSSHTYYCPFYFQGLWVQNGYGTVNETGLGIGSGSYDSFIASTDIAGSTDLQSNILKPWSLANQNLRNQAVIEIVNTGFIEAYFPENIVLKPGEKLIISELPISSANLNSTLYNLVRPLNPLTLNLTTNTIFDQDTEKFFGCSYRISFLNFKMYNPDNTYTNKTANYSIDFNKIVVYEGVVFPKFLFSTYGNQVYVARTLFGDFVCGNNGYYSWSNIKRLSMINTNRNNIFVKGIIMTASNNSPIQRCDFYDDATYNPNTTQLTPQPINQCNQNNFTFYFGY